MTGEELHAHVVQLARDLDVRVWLCLSCIMPRNRGEAKQEDDERTVLLSSMPDEPTAYLVALHELGHHAQPRTWGRWRRLKEEAHAWRWALDNSLIQPGCEEWSEILWRLKSYADDRRYKSDPDFDALLAHVLEQTTQ